MRNIDAMSPQVTGIECIKFSYPIENMKEQSNSFYPGYAPGSSLNRAVFAVRIHTDVGVEGTYVSLNSPPGPALAQVDTVAPYLVGKDPLKRERHWNQFRLMLRKYDRMGIGPLDIALWDFAGKYCDAPIHQLLGTYQTNIPAYASTAFGDDNGGLDSPEAYADFAEECFTAGFSALKLHGWRAESSHLDVKREVDLINVVSERVGEEMDLMYDPVGQLETFADVLAVGRACDEQGYLWLEDPGRDFGSSQHGSRTLAKHIETPLLQTEHVRGFEPHVDFAANEGTTFLRADPEYDEGITGAMKIARAAEGLGLDVEFHICGPAQRHCIAAVRNTNYYELGLTHPDHPVTHDPPVYKGGYSDDISIVDNQGFVPVPNDPGLGVSYDWDYIHKHSTDYQFYE